MLRREWRERVGNDLFVRPVDSGPLKFTSKPYQGGDSISPDGPPRPLPSGTLGGWLRTHTDQLVGISNNHVVSDFNVFGSGDLIISPGLKYSTTHQQIAALLQVTLLKPYNPSTRHYRANRVDLAWFEPLQGIHIDRRVAGIQPLGDEDIISSLSSSNVPIWLQGAESNYLSGNALSIATAFTTYRQYPLLFDEQIHTDISAVEGDSGSLIFNKTNTKIVGLLCGRDGLTGKVVANCWKNVKAAMGCSFLYP